MSDRNYDMNEITEAVHRCETRYRCDGTCPIYGYCDQKLSCRENIYAALVEGRLIKLRDGEVELGEHGVCGHTSSGRTFVTSQPKNKQANPELPKWFNVGQWVYILNGLDEKENIGQIKGMASNNKFANVAYIDDIGYEHLRVCFIDQVLPIRFRPYTLEEAKALIGKTMEYECNNGSGRFTELITEVNDAYDTKAPIINCKGQDCLKHYRATIDGVPVGVPEVDKEAMKEAEQ